MLLISQEFEVVVKAFLYQRSEVPRRIFDHNSRPEASSRDCFETLALDPSGESDVFGTNQFRPTFVAKPIDD